MLFILPLNAAGQTQSLEHYLQVAQRNSPTLRDYQYRLASLGVDSQEIGIVYLPHLNFDAQASVAPVFGGIGYDSTVTNFGSYSALISVSQTLFQGRSAELQQAKRSLDVRSTINAGTLERYDIERAVTEQYTTAYSDLLTLQSSRALLKLISEQAQILQTMVSRGVYPQADYLNISITMRQQEIVSHQRAAQYTLDLYKLNSLCGITDTTHILLEAPLLERSTAIPLSQSIFRRQFAIDSQMIDVNRSLLDREYAPKFGWFADAGILTSMPKTAYRNVGFSVGLNLSIPIYDGGRRSYEYQKFDIAQQTIGEYANFFQSEYYSKRVMLTEALTASDSAIAEYHLQMEQVRALIDFYKQQLAAGNLKVNDFLLAFATMNATQAELDQAEIARLQIINQLNYLNH
ncbi:MAG TPA: TolC family protein [Candidatus Kapabacteria bacterium]|nr:TolC family protein [Candidatus Kapabacteria bacterium]